MGVTNKFQRPISTLLFLTIKHYFAIEMHFFLNLKTKAMPLELLTTKDLQEFKTELLEEMRKLMPLKETPKKLLKTKDVCRMLRISEGTLQNLRNNETIRFKKVGGIIFYKIEDVERLVESNREGVTASRFARFTNPLKTILIFFHCDEIASSLLSCF